MILRLIREAGWSVGAHNDYSMNGIPMTYWLFTGPDNRYIKVEGPTAIEQNLLDSVLAECLASSPEPTPRVCTCPLSAEWHLRGCPVAPKK